MERQLKEAHDELVTRQDGVYANLVCAQHLELGRTDKEHAEDFEQATKADVEDMQLANIMSKTPR